jgi:DNA (cytosine-5)-methyltransferase 1
MKHVELFAGVGGFRMAMQNLQNDFGVSFECQAFSEIDANATKTYKANYNTSDEIEMGDIVNFNSDMSRFDGLDFDLLTGGFPCQAFSMMGKQKGFEDDRGTMFFQIEKILNLKRPRYVLLENVKNLISHDKGNTFKEIHRRLVTLGYTVYYDVFNSMDFKLAQKRSRVIIFATTENLGKDFVFKAEYIKELFQSHLSDFKSLSLQDTVLDILAKSVLPKYYLSERIKPTLLADGSKNFVSKSEINQIIARPLTATMHKMHRACQDNYYSQYFIEAQDPIKYLEKVYSKEELAKQPIRKLTPAEAFALQGFPKTFVINAQKAKVCDGALYKQAGNAISVNVIYAILYYLFVNQGLK